MPWVAVPKRGRRPGRLARLRAGHGETLLAWTAGVVALAVLLGLLFVVAHKLA
jgi:hypothetical protein